MILHVSMGHSKSVPMRLEFIPHVSAQAPFPILYILLPWKSWEEEETNQSRLLRGQMDLRCRRRGRETMRGSDFLLPSGCLYVVLFKHVFYVFLHGVKSTRAFQNTRPPRRQTDAHFSLHFPPHGILLFLCFLSNHWVFSHVGMRCC